ncbi:hypothetical protein RVBP20_3090 [Pseudomonas phage sp. NK1]|nr:hypothetical protein RVBP20_3090 [Pseudomonas phage sp. NK1]
MVNFDKRCLEIEPNQLGYVFTKIGWEICVTIGIRHICAKTYYTVYSLNDKCIYYIEHSAQFTKRIKPNYIQRFHAL